MKSQVWTKIGLISMAGMWPLALLAEEGGAEAQLPAPTFVQAMMVADEKAALSRNFFGRIAAVETVDVSFEVGGYLSMLNAREGALVPEGATLAHLDLAPFERAVSRAEIALEQAIRTEGRLQELATRNVASQVQADDAKTARQLAEVELAEARDALSDATITAPFDGVVADRIGTAFTTIQPGQPILRLHNMSEMRVEFDLPERLFSKIGNIHEVDFEGFVAGVDGSLPLTLREFRTETGTIGQSYTVSLGAELAPTDLLMPGRTITVEVSIPRVDVGIVLPATAVATEPDGQFFVVALRDGETGVVAEHIPVSVSSSNGTSLTVEGVAPDSEIVTVGAHLIDDGQAVQRFTGLTVEGS